MDIGRFGKVIFNCKERKKIRFGFTSFKFAIK